MHARTVQIAALATMFVQIVVCAHDSPLEVPGVGGQHHLVCQGRLLGTWGAEMVH